MNNIFELDISDEKQTDQEEPVFDSPHGSIWIIGVDAWGTVFVVEPPNIHPGLLEFTNAEELGLPPDMEDTPAGIYQARCSYHESRDWETGHVDRVEFDFEELTPLWTDTKQTLPGCL